MSEVKVVFTPSHLQTSPGRMKPFSHRLTRKYHIYPLSPLILLSPLLLIKAQCWWTKAAVFRAKETTSVQHQQEIIGVIVSPIMWVKQCHKPPTWNGLYQLQKCWFGRWFMALFYPHMCFPICGNCGNLFSRYICSQHPSLTGSLLYLIVFHVVFTCPKSTYQSMGDAVRCHKVFIPCNQKQFLWVFTGSAGFLRAFLWGQQPIAKAILHYQRMSWNTCFMT